MLMLLTGSMNLSAQERQKVNEQCVQLLIECRDALKNSDETLLSCKNTIQENEKLIDMQKRNLSWIKFLWFFAGFGIGVVTGGGGILILVLL